MSTLWDGGISTVVDDSDQPRETPILRLDSTKAHTKLGWYPRWPLDEALRRVADWTSVYRDRGDVRQVVLDQIDSHQKVVVQT
jgi:CDP-glucose 4,6-dehydratase